MSYKLHTYDFWSTYLAGGRKKYMRPLYEYGMTIQKANKWQSAGGDLQIQARWAGNIPFITVHNDDSFTLQGGVVNSYWGGNAYNILYSQGIRYRMWKYTGINVFQKDNKIRVIDEDVKFTPTKIQKCRGCSGTGLIDIWCSANTCWNGEFYNAGGLSVYACSDHPDASEPKNNYSRYHLIPCEHGKTDQHTVPRGQQCWNCGGSGKRDYGNKPISLLWDGSPLRVKDKNIVSASMPSLKPMSDLERMLQLNA
jgi:hypothetical protein